MSGRRDYAVSFYLILLDAVTLAASYFISLNLFTLITGKRSANAEIAVLVIFAAFLIVNVLFNTNRFFLKRDRTEEFQAVLKLFVIFIAVLTVLVYVLHVMDELSRIVSGLTALLYFISDYLFRLLLKAFLKKHMKDAGTRLVLITTADAAEDAIRNVLESGRYSRVDGIVITDRDMSGQQIGTVPVVAGRETLFDYTKRSVVDEALILQPDYDEDYVTDVISELGSMGVVVHVALQEFSSLDGFIRQAESVGSYPVLSFFSSEQDVQKMAIKRFFDILFGLIGSLFTLVLTIFIAPAILIESRGPVFFSQLRVGRNGRIFRMYKFRSMYRDAEERKKELMKKNEMNGLMFKMTDDPRITKVGRFLRATSLDEFPQFFNILKGDMSLIGTRPPTIDEFERYQEHHKRRLSMKPGLTGMWQVSGRSTITDFEEVVRLDCYYIDNWSFALDLKIILKTIVAVFTRRGSK